MARDARYEKATALSGMNGMPQQSELAMHSLH